MANIKQINSATCKRIETLLRVNIEDATKIVAKTWKANLPFNGTQLTCSKRDIQSMFGGYLTELLIESEIFGYYNSIDNQVIRRF